MSSTVLRDGVATITSSDTCLLEPLICTWMHPPLQTRILHTRDANATRTHYSFALHGHRNWRRLRRPRSSPYLSADTPSRFVAPRVEPRCQPHVPPEFMVDASSARVPDAPFF